MPDFSPQEPRTATEGSITTTAGRAATKEGKKGTNGKTRAAQVGKSKPNKATDSDSEEKKKLPLEDMIKGLQSELVNQKEQSAKQVEMLTHIYQQTVACHTSEVKMLRDRQNDLARAQFVDPLQRVLDTMLECKGHLKLFQDLVTELARVQNDTLLSDSDRLIKTQMSVSHIQHAATRVCLERLDKDMSGVRSLLDKLRKDPIANARPRSQSQNQGTEEAVFEATKEPKYMQQLEKIRMENEILQNRTGVLEATIHEAETEKKSPACTPSPVARHARQTYSESNLVLSAGSISSSPAAAAGGRDAKRCARILLSISLKRNEMVLERERAAQRLTERCKELGEDLARSVEREEAVRKEKLRLEGRVRELEKKVLAMLEEERREKEARRQRIEQGGEGPAHPFAGRLSVPSSSATDGTRKAATLVNVAALKDELKKCLCLQSKTQSRYYLLLEMAKVIGVR